jgi:hypothetical protein
MVGNDLVWSKLSSLLQHALRCDARVQNAFGGAKDQNFSAEFLARARLRPETLLKGLNSRFGKG